jgi:thioredoxin 1
MLKIYSILLSVLLFTSCTNGQKNSNAKVNLTAPEFATKIKELSNAPVVDVRTPDEYAKGHIENALNIDWKGDAFEKQIATLDKSKPVMVYCLSGGRSSAAVDKMASLGFTQIYEMTGGIMKWRGSNLPEVATKKANNSMTSTQFQALLESDKLVLIDFYAEWCAPCRKMKPYLEEISKEMADKVVVIRIDADDNQALCKEMKIDALPVLQLYKDKKMTWNYNGFIEKADVVKQLSL